jgi:hypothetical protein
MSGLVGNPRLQLKIELIRNHYFLLKSLLASVHFSNPQRRDLGFVERRNNPEDQ